MQQYKTVLNAIPPIGLSSNGVIKIFPLQSEGEKSYHIWKGLMNYLNLGFK